MTKEQAQQAMKDRRTVEGGKGEDYDTGVIIAIDGEKATVAWRSGVRTPAFIADLSIV